MKGMASSPADSRVAEPAGRDLVGGRAVGVEVGVGGLDHHPLAGRHGPQGGEVGGAQGPGVGVGEEAGLLEDGRARGGQVLDGRGVAVVGQPRGGRRVAVLGGLAQGEEGLVASGGPSRPGDVEDLVEGEVGRRQPGRGLGERAVAAPVPAQHGQGDEDLGGEGHPGAEGQVAHVGRPGHELGQRGGQERRTVQPAPRSRLVGAVVGRHRRHLTGSEPGSHPAGPVRRGTQKPLAAITGAFRWTADMSPKNTASPNGWTAPLAVATQYPAPSLVANTAVAGLAPPTPDRLP